MDSPELRPSIAGSLDSPFVPGGFAHSMPPQDSLPFLPNSPGLSSLSPLTPLQSLSFPFTLELPVSAFVQSDHTSSPSLAFLFNQSVYPVELDFDPVMFGPGRVKHRLHSSSRVLVDSQELDPGASRDVLAAYL